jgi:hypothetical protein
LAGSESEIATAKIAAIQALENLPGKKE